MNDVENAENDTFGSYCALLVAFKTMKERCQQLQTRLVAVEEENMCLRLECGREMAVVKVDKSDRSALQTLQVCYQSNWITNNCCYITASTMVHARSSSQSTKLILNLLQYLRHSVDFSRILKSESGLFC